MEQNNKDKKDKKNLVLKITKLYSAMLIIVGVISLFYAIIGLIMYTQGEEYLVSKGFDPQSMVSDILELLFVAIYGIVGGIWLLSLKKQVMYIVCGIGIWNMFWAIFNLLITLDVWVIGILGIIEIIIGIFAIYLFRNREYFNETKHGHTT